MTYQRVNQSAIQRGLNISSLEVKKFDNNLTAVVDGDESLITSPGSASGFDRRIEPYALKTYSETLTQTISFPGTIRLARTGELSSRSVSGYYVSTPSEIAAGNAPFFAQGRTRQYARGSNSITPMVFSSTSILHTISDVNFKALEGIRLTNLSVTSSPVIDTNITNQHGNSGAATTRQQRQQVASDFLWSITQHDRVFSNGTVSFQFEIIRPTLNPNLAENAGKINFGNVWVNGSTSINLTFQLIYFRDFAVRTT